MPERRVEELIEELDVALADSIRRATTRAEHIRLVHIHTTVENLKAELDVEPPEEGIDWVALLEAAREGNPDEWIPEPGDEIDWHEGVRHA